MSEFLQEKGELISEIEWLLNQIDHDVLKVIWHLSNSFLATSAYIHYRDGSEIRVNLAGLDDAHAVMKLVWKVMNNPKAYQPKHAAEAVNDEKCIRDQG